MKAATLIDIWLKDNAQHALLGTARIDLRCRRLS